MTTHIVIVENQNEWLPAFPEVEIVLAKDYLGKTEYLKLKRAHIINFCGSYRYLSTGYYCSLLAEARRHKILPSVRTITDLSHKAIYSLDADEMEKLADKQLSKKLDIASQNKFAMYILFGFSEVNELQGLARQIFDVFSSPLLRVEFHLQDSWQIASIKALSLRSLPLEKRDFFTDAFQRYLSSRWRKRKLKSNYRYDLAILHNPQEVLPPSNKAALQKFISAGKKQGVNVELIEKKDYGRLAEYDALFIRETTNIDHYTYQFSRKAESEGMVVMDDPHSIVMCTNKVYLSELLNTHKIPRPKTLILRKNDNTTNIDEIAYPVVLKIPDGSFSRGVFKAETAAKYEEITTSLFKESDLILAQEFLYTEFDWRIGVLNRQPIFACQYFMSKSHWQIVKYDAKGKPSEGGYKAWNVGEVPDNIVNTAVAAANLIGNGFYGVDVKQNVQGVYVIEVNDNPNLETGVEDAYEGNKVYEIIIAEFVRRLDAQKAV
jgi:glutathione synthase/RimK-type ligase-like ATP-grasp enzyme